jgi:hypothetical protein
MCNGDQDVYSCGCIKKDWPIRECRDKRWGQDCPYALVITRYWGRDLCADCDEIKSLEDRLKILDDENARLRRLRMLEDENARLRMQSGRRSGHGERQREEEKARMSMQSGSRHGHREGDAARLTSRIVDLRRKKRVRFGR